MIERGATRSFAWAVGRKHVETIDDCDIAGVSVIYLTLSTATAHSTWSLDLAAEVRMYVCVSQDG